MTANSIEQLMVEVRLLPEPCLWAWEIRDPAGLPLPTPRFRRRSWLEFQRALDPLAPPKSLPPAAATRRPRPPPGGD